jgi:hypothetical protein
LLHRFAFLPLLALSALAQNNAVIDNDMVRVLKVTQTAHNKTRLHQHKVNRVMIYLQPGRQAFEYPDAPKKMISWTAGQALWSPAGGMHTAEIVSDGTVTIIEIELKKPGSSKRAGGIALDPLKVSPKHYKLEMENDQVRVVRVKVGPKESIPMHEHVLGRVTTALRDQNFRVTSADGKVDMVKHSAGDVSWGGAGKHKEENLSDHPFEALMVEIKE